MSRTHSLPLLLASLLPFGVLAPACSSPHESTKGQLIECTTDPATGVVLRCQPASTGTGGANTCVDVDEDGDGEPHDGMDDKSGGTSSLLGRADDGGGGDADDDDGDGVPNDEDCDHHAGEDDDGDNGGGVDLPYDLRLSLGQTAAPIHDAFAEEGAQPASIVSVTGATWRITELAAGTPFVVTADDCSHVGNRDVGRDRVVVSWKTADGATHADHLDLRYCE